MSELYVFSDEEIKQAYIDDVRSAFGKYDQEFQQLLLAEKAEHKKREGWDEEQYQTWLTEFYVKSPGYTQEDDSHCHEWALYESLRFDWTHVNSCDVYLPVDSKLSERELGFICQPRMIWCVPCVQAKIVDDKASMYIHIVLVDYWDSERETSWKARLSTVNASII